MATWIPKTQRWVKPVTIKGKRISFYSKHSAADADAKAREAKQASTQPSFDASTFAGFVYGPWRANTFPEIRPLTKKKYNGLLRNHILEAPVRGSMEFGELPLASICLEDMQALKASLVFKGPQKRDAKEKDLSKAHERSVLLLVKSILQLARKSGRIQREDWDLIKVPPAPKKKVREEPEADFTQRILNAAKEYKPWMSGPLFAALFLGLRRGEVAGLKWNHVDRKNLCVNVSNQRQKFDGATHDVAVKSDDSNRRLEIESELLAWLDKLGNKGSIYVFTGSEGYPISPAKITAAMPGLCKKAGVPVTTFHDLRSHAASNLAALEIDPWCIMSILGHSRLDTTGLYVNSKRNQRREALSKLLKTLAG